MEEREGFVENSKVAFKGIANGIFGSFVYELIISVIVTIMITTNVTNRNPGATEEELNTLVNMAFDSFPFSLIISCLSSLAVLVVFIVIIKFSKFKELCKKAISFKSLKYGFICGLCIMGFSILYNSSIITIFNLEDAGNANQEGVIVLIKENVILGFLSVVVLAPLVEELTYRYCLFGEMAKKKKWVGYLISGIVFMLMHSVSSFISYGFSKELLIGPEILPLAIHLFSQVLNRRTNAIPQPPPHLNSMTKNI